MKNVILASIGILLGSVSFAQAGVPALDLQNAVKQAVAADHILLVSDNDGDGGENSGDDNGSDDNGAGDDSDSNDDNSADDSDDDDNGDDKGDDHVDAKSRTDKVGLAKGGRKVRVPGGTGCDDAGDVIEHPECRSN